MSFLRAARTSDDVLIKEIDELHYLSIQTFTRREAAGLSQAALGELAGLTQAQIARIEAGHANPTSRTLARLAYALDCGVTDLYAPRECDDEVEEEIRHAAEIFAQAADTHDVSLDEGDGAEPHMKLFDNRLSEPRDYRRFVEFKRFERGDEDLSVDLVEE